LAFVDPQARAFPSEGVHGRAVSPCIKPAVCNSTSTPQVGMLSCMLPCVPALTSLYEDSPAGRLSDRAGMALFHPDKACCMPWSAAGAGSTQPPQQQAYSYLRELQLPYCRTVQHTWVSRDTCRMKVAAHCTALLAAGLGQLRHMRYARRLPAG
jgi:hypothetical protein